MAKAQDQAILMVFAGSDWCRPCMKFKNDILQTSTFIDFAKDNIIIVYLDFPARKKNQLPKEQRLYNERLAEKYNEKGFFPHLVLLDADGKILSEPKFAKQNSDEFVTEVQTILDHSNSER